MTPYRIRRGDPFWMDLPVRGKRGAVFAVDTVEVRAESDSPVAVVAGVATPPADTSDPRLYFAKGALDGAPRWSIVVRLVKDDEEVTTAVASVTVSDSPFVNPAPPPDPEAVIVSTDADNALSVGTDGGAFLDLADLGGGGAGVLTVANRLSEFSTDQQKADARGNLGLQTIDLGEFL